MPTTAAVLAAAAVDAAAAIAAAPVPAAGQPCDAEDATLAAALVDEDATRPCSLGGAESNRVFKRPKRIAKRAQVRLAHLYR